MNHKYECDLRFPTSLLGEAKSYFQVGSDTELRERIKRKATVKMRQKTLPRLLSMFHVFLFVGLTSLGHLLNFDWLVY